MYLTHEEYRQLVADVADAVAKKLRPMLQKKQATDHPDTCTWLTPKEAAEMLRISLGQLYHIKDELTCIKLGQFRSSPIRFRKETLLDDYKAARSIRQRSPDKEAKAPGLQGKTAQNADGAAVTPQRG